MYVTWKKLSKNFENKSYRNYFKTFGFLVIKDFLTKSEFNEWRKEYDECYKRHFGTSIKNLMKKSGRAFVPNFVDNSEFYSKKAFEDRFIDIAKYFCGDDFLYMGSDGSAFNKDSFKWHRDWFTHTPVAKINIYLNSGIFLGGRFLIFPGSQIPSDSYPNLLNKGLAWPFGETKDGGLNEREYFPFTPSPRRSFFKSNFEKIFKRKFKLPYASLKINKGDILIFDQRAIHVVEKTFPVVTRRLLTLLFAENPSSLKQNHYLFNPPEKATRDGLTEEIKSLFWLERELIKVPPYGKYIDRNHRLYPNHLFTNKISQNQEKSEVDISKYSSYKDKADNKNIFYTDNMLGFNLSHIRDIDS